MIEGTMTTRVIRKRLARLEKWIDPEYDDDGDVPITLEELCRRMWKRDKEHFMKLVEGTIMNVLVYQFQAEDEAEAAENHRRRLHTW